MARRLNIILFGATGFTGKYTIQALYKLTKANGRNLQWGVAGRSKLKLENALAEASKSLKTDMNNIPILLADINDEKSLVDMAKSADVIINTIGPYRYYGEVVVKACLEAGTHHVDVSGEPHYMEVVQHKYHEAAKDRHVYIVSACGYDSIPMDLGLTFLERRFEGDVVNSVETYLSQSGGDGGPIFNYATWQSAIEGFAKSKELAALRLKQKARKLPELLPKLAARGTVHLSKVTNKWCIPFLGSDRSVALRSQKHFYELEGKRPIQIQTYYCLDSYKSLALMLLFGPVFVQMIRYDYGRKLLLKYPELFSNGVFSKQPPTPENLETVQASLLFVGESLSGRTLKTQIRMGNPAYAGAAICVTLAAIKLLEESNKLPENGGVFSPAAAFSKTSMIEELQENGITFEVLEKPLVSKL